MLSQHRDNDPSLLRMQTRVCVCVCACIQDKCAETNLFLTHAGFCFDETMGCWEQQLNAGETLGFVAGAQILLRLADRVLLTRRLTCVSRACTHTHTARSHCFRFINVCVYRRHHKAISTWPDGTVHVRENDR